MGDEEEEEDEEEDDEEEGRPIFDRGFMNSMMRAFKEKLGNQSQEDKKMDKNEPDTVEILLRRAENGFVVEVDYPRRMIPNPQLDGVQTIFSSFAKMSNQGANEADPSAIMKTISDTIAKAAKPSKPIRKSHEEYVFQSMETMISFIKETLESAEAADNAPPTK